MPRWDEGRSVGVEVDVWGGRAGGRTKALSVAWWRIKWRLRMYSQEFNKRTLSPPGDASGGRLRSFDIHRGYGLRSLVGHAGEVWKLGASEHWMVMSESVGRMCEILVRNMVGVAEYDECVSAHRFRSETSVIPVNLYITSNNTSRCEAALEFIVLLNRTVYFCHSSGSNIVFEA
jgi:hypothetical protein